MTIYCEGYFSFLCDHELIQEVGFHSTQFPTDMDFFPCGTKNKTQQVGQVPHILEGKQVKEKWLARSNH